MTLWLQHSADQANPLQLAQQFGWQLPLCSMLNMAAAQGAHLTLTLTLTLTLALTLILAVTLTLTLALTLMLNMAAAQGAHGDQEPKPRAQGSHEGT